MANSTSNIDLIAQAQASKEVTANAALDAASLSMTYGRRQSTCSGLTFGYYGGNVTLSSGTMSQIANGTLTLTASATNYIVANKATGAVSFSTATTNWNDSANYWRLYSAVVGAATVTSYIDSRELAKYTGGGGSGYKNILINGEVTRINQRGIANWAAVANGAYGYDRWKKIDASNMTQIIEDGNYAPSSVYTLSGNGVTTQQVTSPASGHWTLPNIPISATYVQLEIGGSASQFEKRPLGLEMTLCQRYLPSFVGIALADPCGVGVFSSPAGGYFTYLFKTTARVPPTGVSISSAGDFVAGIPGIVSSVGTALVFNAAGIDGGTLLFTGTGTPYTAGAFGTLRANNGSARILFTGCEL